MFRRPNAVRALRLVILALAAALAWPAAAVDAPPAVTEALARADTAVRSIIEIPEKERTFSNTVGAIDDLIALLDIDTSMIQFMAYVSTDAAERAAGEAAEETIRNWQIELLKNVELYEAIRAYADTNPKLEGERARLLAHTLRDYRRAGMELTAEQREDLKAIQMELTGKSIEFERSIREDETRVPLTRAELSGMSNEYLASLKQSGDMYLVGMSYPEFLPIMDLCDNETTRQKVWLAYKRRGGVANVRVLEEILRLRARAADILGYAHPADYEIEIKMAKNAGNVKAFYEKLRPLVREKAERDYVEYLAAKQAHTGNAEAKLYPWDTTFYKNLLMKEKYAVDGEKVREYFPIERVIDGLFSITQSLYGLEYRDVTARVADERPLWHEDVKVYEVVDTASGDMLGTFYLDLHPRPNKYGHAAQWGLVQHKIWADGTVTRPVAALVCNFTKPTDEKPSLMTHDEVETFFHEFGHCLHTILSEAEFTNFAGTSVERDFVEAPSQMFENWVWNGDVLGTFARHYETGEAFPDELLAGMLEARFLGSGLLAERQFYYGLFDMCCHLEPSGVVDTTQLAMDLWDPAGENVELYDPVDHTFFHAAFGHLTGYQAGYYGYQWSLVYACDMFQRFNELGMLSPSAGMYYRKKILARGGSLDGLDLVRDYLGREPDMDAYLKHLGLE